MLACNRIKGVCVFFVSTDQRQEQINQIKQQNHQQVLNLKSHYSLDFPPREDNKTPTTNNIEANITETTEVLMFISSFTKGCTTAKIMKAIPKFINPLPSSLRPLRRFI